LRTTRAGRGEADVEVGECRLKYLVECGTWMPRSRQRRLTIPPRPEPDVDLPENQGILLLITIQLVERSLEVCEVLQRNAVVVAQPDGGEGVTGYYRLLWLPI
jgi:hypothetical protein